MVPVQLDERKRLVVEINGCAPQRSNPIAELCRRDIAVRMSGLGAEHQVSGPVIVRPRKVPLAKEIEVTAGRIMLTLRTACDLIHTGVIESQIQARRLIELVREGVLGIVLPSEWARGENSVVSCP